MNIKNIIFPMACMLSVAAYGQKVQVKTDSTSKKAPVDYSKHIPESA